MMPKIKYTYVMNAVRKFRPEPKNLDEEIELILDTELVWKYIKQIFK